MNNLAVYWAVDKALNRDVDQAVAERGAVNEGEPGPVYRAVYGAVTGAVYWAVNRALYRAVDGIGYEDSPHAAVELYLRAVA
jgi:hypothetical protein